MANYIHIAIPLFLIATNFLTLGAIMDSADSSKSQAIPSEDPLILERVNFLTNKTVKILIGQNKPRPVMQGPNSPNQNNYPQRPSGGDLAGQGSGPQPNYHQQQQAIPQQQPHPPQQNQPNNGVPEIYMQIITAIEKLVGRMDQLDSRLKTVENIVYHITTNKKDPLQQGNCPEKFLKVDGIRGKCYHISSLEKTASDVFEVYDWKSAHAECRKIGGRLVEMIHHDDFLRISQFLVKHANVKKSPAASTDYWIGGINPGLIWIWSESGQKVGMDGRFWNENDNSSNAPGCLKLSFSHRLDAFFFKGAPCQHSQNILCEVMDNTVSRALAVFEQELSAVDDHSNDSL